MTQPSEQTAEQAQTRAALNLSVHNPVGKTSIIGDPHTDEISIDITLKSPHLSASRAAEAVEYLDVITQTGPRSYAIQIDQNQLPDWAQGGFGNFLKTASIDLQVTCPAYLNLKVENNVGKLIVEKVVIAERLNLISNVGKIVFHGQIGPQGQHQMSSSTGKIEIKLAAGSAFKLQAETSVGKISANLPLQNMREGRAVVGQTLSGIYGENPEAVLKLNSSVGKIDISA